MSQSGKPSGFNLMDTMVRVFPPDPPAEKQIEGNENQAKAYKYWQRQVLISSIVGYAGFYFVRSNWSITMPALEEQMGITKTELGLYVTLHGIIYGISKFINGFFGDRVNARTYMVTGLLLSAGLNAFMGMQSMAIWLGIFWMLNGWVQGMGFPPCARLITNWFSPKVLTTKFSIWNTGHSIGAALILIIGGYVVDYDWRLGFFVPAVMAVAVALYLKFTLPDLPPSVGLPEIEGTEAKAPDEAMSAEEQASFKKLLWDKVFTNRYIWIVSFANFFVYIVRYGVMTWAPSFLKDVKGYDMKESGWMAASLEISGIAGMLVGGLLSDKLFAGRGSRTCFFYMTLCALSFWMLWQIPDQTPLITTILLSMTGFFIYGPQSLVGPIVSNLATKRAAASAVGLTGLLGYSSTIVTGVGIGYLAKEYGWNAGFSVILGSAVLGTIFFLAAWTAPRDTYNSSAK